MRRQTDGDFAPLATAQRPLTNFYAHRPPSRLPTFGKTSQRRLHNLLSTTRMGHCKKVKIEPLRHGDTECNNGRNLRDSVSSW